MQRSSVLTTKIKVLYSNSKMRRTQRLLNHRAMIRLMMLVLRIWTMTKMTAMKRQL